MDEVLEKAKAILADIKEQEEKTDICIRAGICPVCGEKLDYKCEEESLEKEYFRFLWIFKIKMTPYIVTYKQCSVNGEHYKRWEYYNSGSDFYY